MRRDHLVERVVHFIILSPAAVGSILGQESLFHKIGKQCWVGPVSYAEQVLEALHGRGVRIGKRDQR